VTVSFWLEDGDDDRPSRPPLDGSLDVDIVVVGGGFTGLWTARELLRRDPSRSVLVLEAAEVGFGASGRNGGWCSATFAASHDKIATRYGRDAAVAMKRFLCDTVDEVGRATSEEGIDAEFQKGGTLRVATSPTHVSRLRATYEHEVAWGFGPPDHEWLTPEEVARRVRVEGCEGALYTPHCARIHPAKLARGLARAVEHHGGIVYEQTPALSIAPERVETPGGTLRAGAVVRATEAYTVRLEGMRRRLLPLYSLMVATEPLPASARPVGEAPLADVRVAGVVPDVGVEPERLEVADLLHAEGLGVVLFEVPVEVPAFELVVFVGLRSLLDLLCGDGVGYERDREEQGECRGEHHRPQWT
jgi:glycine/D-amino acid oxidase-like deaminating enzyme